jgi:hypothetical protein
MSVMLLSPFTQVFRRSAPKDTPDVMTGRWFAVNAAGLVVVPGTDGLLGLYLCLEGNKGHKGSNLEFGNVGTGYASTNSFTLPSVVQSGECALAYGAFRYEVGPEGCDPLSAGPGSLAEVGTLVAVDQYGRIIPAGANVPIGKVEAVATDANGITKLTVRTFGN